MTGRSSDDLPLAAEFPPASYGQWRKLAEQVVNDARIEDRLESRTADDLRVKPLYARVPNASPVAGRRPGDRWQVLQRIDHPDPAASNTEALHELENGANGLVVVGAGSAGAHGYGLNAAEGLIERVLRGIHFDAGIAIEFDLSPQTKDLPLALATLVKGQGIAPSAVDIRFGFDPLGAVILGGGFPLPWSEFGPLAARLAAELAGKGFTRHLVVADGRIIHGAGGTEVQELAYALATAVAYLRAFEASGISIDNARRMIFFRLAADADQFLTIAKFRALRKLWQRIEESCGLAPAAAFIGAETAWRTMTRDDPYVNIVRATIATFAAGLGGADAVTVLPFTAARGLPDRFARRVARNTQLILLDEANLAKVADPAAGSGWNEDLTTQLGRAAWAQFQEIEAAGGAASAIEQGLIQEKVAAARAQLERDAAARKLVLVGANAFPDVGDASVAVLDVAKVEVPPMPTAIAVEPLPPVRLAEPFERPA